MKKIYLLIGPKGSGKSFIGMLFQKYFHIPFIRVEDWAKTVKKERSATDDDYVQEAFQAIEFGIRDELNNTETLVFESTGLSIHFDKMLASLSQDFQVITIKVEATPELCLDRVKSRDQSIHINVSDEQVLAINEAVAQKETNTDHEITNINKSEEELKLEIHEIIAST